MGEGEGNNYFSATNIYSQLLSKLSLLLDFLIIVPNCFIFLHPSCVSFTFFLRSIFLSLCLPVCICVYCGFLLPSTCFPPRRYVVCFVLLVFAVVTGSCTLAILEFFLFFIIGCVSVRGDACVGIYPQSKKGVACRQKRRGGGQGQETPRKNTTKKKKGRWEAGSGRVERRACRLEGFFPSTTPPSTSLFLDGDALKVPQRLLEIYDDAVRQLRIPAIDKEFYELCFLAPVRELLSALNGNAGNDELKRELERRCFPLTSLCKHLERHLAATVRVLQLCQHRDELVEDMLRMC
ncbi:hypothetical protein TcCL_Unassigned05788, partial [Trypanosoma cruzi]